MVPLFKEKSGGGLREAAHSRSLRVIARWSRVLLFCYVALVACPIRYWPITTDPDNTWVFALNYAAAHGLAMGRDIVWNTGPLGYLSFPQNLGDNLWRALVLQTVLWGVVIAVLADLFFREGFSLQNLAPFALFFGLSAPLFWFNRNGVENLLLAVALVLLVVNRWRGGMLAYVVALTLLGITPLIKPTAAMIGGGALGGYLIDRVVVLRWQAWRYVVLAALVPVLVAGSLCWLTLPSFDAFREFLRATAEITGAYSIAMSYPGQRIELLVTVETVALLGGLLALQALYSRRAALFFALLFALPMFISAKHGLVRHDIHFVNFLCFSALAMALVCLRLDWLAWRPMTPWLVLLPAVVLWQDYVPKHLGHWAAFSESSGLRAGRRVWRALTRFGSLRESLRVDDPEAFWPGQSFTAAQLLEPEIRAIIRDEPVASLSVAYSSAALDGLNLRLYPIVQRYNAYTAYLDGLNARWIRNQGPHFLIFDGITIDGRQLWAETPQMWLEVYRWYNTRLLGSRNLLLERRDGPRFGHLEPLGSFSLPSTHRIELPVSTRPIFWTLQCGMTTVGKLREVLFRVPQVTVELALNSHTREPARVIIDVLSSPVLGNFLPSTLAELADLFQTDIPDHSVSALTFGGNGFRFYSPCAVEFFRVAP